MLREGEQMKLNGWTFTSLKQENIMNVTFKKNSLQPPTSLTMIDVPAVLKKSALKEKKGYSSNDFISAIYLCAHHPLVLTLFSSLSPAVF